MKFVEETGGSWTAEQLRAAEAEIEQQKREWEANRLAAIKKEEEEEKRAADEDEMLTYSREDAQNQVNNNKFSKRNPVNRRLLKVKESDRHGIVKNNKTAKGKLTNAKQPNQTVVAQKMLGRPPRRALRNNSKPTPAPISRLAQSNSPKKNATSSSSPSSAPKRAPPMRLSARMSKKAKLEIVDDTNVISSDDEPLISPNKNNGIANNYGKTEKNDNDTMAEHSECSEQRHSEEFDDSECSLDVMVDSTDPQESDEEDTAADDDDNDDDAILVQSDGSIMSYDENDGDATKENSAILKNNADTNHQIDINSPRSTRSHGRIKIDLWTLDKSQNVPELCAKRIHNKTGSSKSTSHTTGNDIFENGNGSSTEDINDDDADGTGDTKTANTSDTKTIKTNQIDQTNDNVRSRKSLTKSTKSTANTTGAGSTAIGLNAKNHLFDLNRTPKVVLNKHECDAQQKARLKSKT